MPKSSAKKKKTIKTRSKEGSIYYDAAGVLRVRVRYTDAAGRSHEMKRRPEPQNYQAAYDLRREMYEEIKAERHPESIDRSFDELAEHYKSEYLKPPRYVGDVKVSGLRSYKSSLSNLKPVQKFFGPMRLQSISYEDLANYKQRRLNTRTVHDEDRKIASVHRELQLLRRMLNVARKKRWIAENPFRAGEPLINLRIETSRMRILTEDEERRLLAACHSRREHLYLSLVTALDTALRAGEQYSLMPADVDLDEGIITVRPITSKPARKRIVPIPQRLRDALSPHLAKLKHGAKRVFPHVRNRRSFATACRMAKIENFRWHDLRHTATMRMLDATKDPAKVMKITGHTTWATFLVYVNLNPETMREVATAMDARRARAVELASEAVN